MEEPRGSLIVRIPKSVANAMQRFHRSEESCIGAYYFQTGKDSITIKFEDLVKGSKIRNSGPKRRVDAGSLCYVAITFTTRLGVGSDAEIQSPEMRPRVDTEVSVSLHG